MATDSWVDQDGIPVPAGRVHAWLPGTYQTLCGLSTKRSSLGRFSHVDWADVQPPTGREAARVAAVCPKCAGAVGRKRDIKPWTREVPRQRAGTELQAPGPARLTGSRRSPQ